MSIVSGNCVDVIKVRDVGDFGIKIINQASRSVCYRLFFCWKRVDDILTRRTRAQKGRCFHDDGEESNFG